MATNPTLTPRLVVDDAVATIAFYTNGLGATERSRFAEPSGKIVQVEMVLGDDLFTLTEADGQYNGSPRSLGGSPVLLTVAVDDAHAVGAAMEQAGAEITQRLQE